MAAILSNDVIFPNNFGSNIIILYPIILLFTLLGTTNSYN